LTKGKEKELEVCKPSEEERCWTSKPDGEEIEREVEKEEYDWEDCKESDYSFGDNLTYHMTVPE
jgi:hypothetical protein